MKLALVLAFVLLCLIGWCVTADADAPLVYDCIAVASLACPLVATGELVGSDGSVVLYDFGGTWWAGNLPAIYRGELACAPANAASIGLTGLRLGFWAVGSKPAPEAALLPEPRFESAVAAGVLLLAYLGRSRA